MGGRRIRRYGAAGIVGLLLVLAIWMMLNRSADPVPVAPSEPAAPAPSVEEPMVIGPIPIPAPEPPPTPAPVEVVAPPPPPETVQVEVRDLYDGLPVPGLEFTTSGDPPLRCATGEDGRVEVLLSALGALAPVDEAWRIVPNAFPAGEGPPTLWLYRMVRIEGRVEGRSDVAKLDPAAVRILILGLGETVPPGDARPLLDNLWFSRHHLDRLTNLVDSVAEDGSFEALAPRLPGFRATAAAPGWVPATVLLHFDVEPARADLLLEKHSLTISGTLRDENGKPVPGAVLQGFVVVRMPASEYDPAVPAASGHGYKSVVDQGRDARIFYILQGRTDEEGRFTLSSNVAGELWMVTVPTDTHRAAWVSLPRLTGDLGDVDLVVESGDETAVEFRRSGTPLRRQELALTDLTHEAQPGHYVTLDHEGRCTSSHLERGHRIRIDFVRDRTKSWYLEWDGRKVVDLADLPTRNPWLREK